MGGGDFLVCQYSEFHRGNRVSAQWLGRVANQEAVCPPPTTTSVILVCSEDNLSTVGIPLLIVPLQN